MKRSALFIATFTLGAGLSALGLVACGDDDNAAAGTADAAPEAAADGSSSSSGGGQDSGDGGGNTSSSGGGKDAGDDGDAAPITYAIGGSVTGLSGAGLVLQNNGADDLAVSANGTFTFPTHVASGMTYAVTVKTQPSAPAQTCAVSGGTGTVGSDNVTSIVVSCAADAYTIGGTASGLTGNAVLRNNGGNDLVVSANGSFAFSETLSNGQGYDVTVASNPPGQTCVVGNGTGNISGANVASVTLTCTTDTFAIGGMVTGLGDGKSLQLTNNGGDPVVVGTNGAFAFATKLGTGATYDVAPASQPAGQTCTVSGGKGTVGTADVSSVVVNCADGAFTVGGNVTGLSGTLVLRNGAGELSVTANGSFAFPDTLANSATYKVTVQEHPLGQTCTVSNASGTIANADVTNVTVTCTTNTYTISGSIVGLSGNLVLQNNGGNNLSQNTPGAFTFTSPVPYGGTYNVTVHNQPSGQVCTVTNGSGVVGATNVTNVLVTCENKHSVGGSVGGLAGGTSVVLQNNGGDNLTVNLNGKFVFATPLSEGQTYDVTIMTQPTNRTCTVSNGSGTIGTSDVTNVSVMCTP